jgi:hypothetical protein
MFWILFTLCTILLMAYNRWHFIRACRRTLVAMEAQRLEGDLNDTIQAEAEEYAATGTTRYQTCHAALLRKMRWHNVGWSAGIVLNTFCLGVRLLLPDTQPLPQTHRPTVPPPRGTTSVEHMPLSKQASACMMALVPESALLSAKNPAVLDLSIPGMPQLLFDASTREQATWHLRIPPECHGGMSPLVDITFSMVSATSGSVAFDIQSTPFSTDMDATGMPRTWRRSCHAPVPGTAGHHSLMVCGFETEELPVDTPLTLQIARAITHPYDTATGDVAVHRVNVGIIRPHSVGEHATQGSGDVTSVGSTATPAWVNMPTMCTADMQLTIDGKNNVVCESLGGATSK